MRKVLLTLLQFVLFLLTYTVATFVLPFHREQILVHTATITRIFLWDGLLAVGLLLLLLLALEAATRRLRTSAPFTLLALALAVAVSFALKLGFVTHEF